MSQYKAILAAILVVAALHPNCDAQLVPFAAPASVAPSLIQYTGAAEYAKPEPSHLVFYKEDGTFQEINSYLQNLDGSITTYAPGSGTYTYSIDPLNPSHATIVYNGSTDPTTFDNLYFYSAIGGLQVATQVSAVIAQPFFRFSPEIVTNGGVNVSNRCQLNSGAVAISGFVVQSTGPRWVLLRAVGATLANFGVAGVVSTPSFTVYDSTQTSVGTSSVWSSDPNLIGGYSTIFSLAGAFPLKSGSDEGVLLVQLNPGAYTGVFKAGSSGTILCEVYILPF
jgi:hypothetical protein